MIWRIAGKWRKCKVNTVGRKILKKINNLIRSDLSQEEYDSMKEETVDQIKEFTETLDRMNKTDLLSNSFSQMRKVRCGNQNSLILFYWSKSVFLQKIRQAIANSFNTIEMIKMFGEQNATEMEAVLLSLDQEYRLKKIPTDEYETRKVKFVDLVRSI